MRLCSIISHVGALRFDCLCLSNRHNASPNNFLASAEKIQDHVQNPVIITLTVISSLVESWHPFHSCSPQPQPDEATIDREHASQRFIEEEREDQNRGRDTSPSPSSHHLPRCPRVYVYAHNDYHSGDNPAAKFPR